MEKLVWVEVPVTLFVTFGRRWGARVTVKED